MKQKNFIIKIIVIGFIIFFISHFFIQICFVNGDSMLPTLKNGDGILIKKFNLNIKNNDIVVIKKNDKILIKRVIGIPGDRIIIKDGIVFINNLEFDNRITNYSGNAEVEITLLENQYYVLGDNREHSIDSRDEEIGIIKKNEILGTILFSK